MELVQHSTTTESPKQLFQLSDGSGLFYALPRKGKLFFGTYDLEMAWNHCRKTKDKKWALKIHGWKPRKGSSLFALFADFDKLPNNFDSWNLFYHHLTKVLEDRAIVFRSYSGKVKALFLIDMKGKGKMSQNKASSILADELPDELFNICDQTLGGMSLCFLNFDSLEKLSENLVTLKPICPNLNNKSETIEDKTIQPYRTFEVLYSMTREIGGDLFSGHICRERIENLISKFFLDFENPLVMRFIKFALANPALKWGFCISQDKLGKTLNVSRRTAGRLLKKKEVKALLEVTAPYVSKKRPTQFKAKESLLAALNDLYPADPQKASLPIHIPDGKWNYNIKHFGLRCFSHNPYELVQWIKTIPGFDKGDRLQQAIFFAEWMQRKLRGENVQ